MKESINNIIAMEKVKAISHVLLMTFVILVHVNFIFSDCISTVSFENIELSDHSENENKEDIKNYDCAFSPLNYRFSFRIEKFVIEGDYYTLHNQFIDVFTPPPEFI